MNKFIKILIAVGALVATIGGWKLWRVNRETVSLPTSTSQMIQQLDFSIDDGGESEMHQLEQEVEGLD